VAKSAEEPAPAPPPPAAPVNEAANPTPAAPAADTGADDPTAEVVGFLTAQLQIFIKERGRLPNDFREFAGARLDSVPQPPPGRKFVIDPNTRQVKLVKAK
jgi:hypothetical protein